MAQAKYPFEEYTRVAWLAGEDAIDDINEPLLADVTNESVDITCYLTKDGLTIGGTTNAVDSAALCSRVDSQKAGSVGYSPMLTMFRYHDDDVAWDLTSWGTEGFLVVRRGPRYDSAWAAGQAVEVYKVQMGEKIPADSATNAMQTFQVALFVDQADLDATIVAS